MFVDLHRPLNASSPLSASAELLVIGTTLKISVDNRPTLSYAQILFDWRAWTTIYRMVVQSKTVHAGGPAYDGEVVCLDGVTRRLLHFQRGRRPLVLIFGSCT